MSKKVILIYSLVVIAIGIGGAVFINLNYANHPIVHPALESNDSGVIKNTDRTADIGFVKYGTVNYVAKKIGDQVAAGEVLAKINSADVAAQYAQAQNGVTITQANLAALQDLLKGEELKVNTVQSDAKKIQKKQVAATKDDIAAQMAVVLQAQNNVKNLAAQLGNDAIVAPFDGTITRQNIELGEVVSPNVSVITISAENNLSQSKS